MSEYSGHAWEMAVNITRPLAPSDALVELCQGILPSARRFNAVQLERCNGDRPIRQTDQNAWRSQLDKEERTALNDITNRFNGIKALPEIDSMISVSLTIDELYLKIVLRDSQGRVQREIVIG